MKTEASAQTGFFRGVRGKEIIFASKTHLAQNMKITSLEQLDLGGFYTYADYLRWQFEERVELLRGKIRQMAAPSMKHQRTVTHIGLPPVVEDDLLSTPIIPNLELDVTEIFMD